MWNPLPAFIASQPGRHFGSERTRQTEGLERGEACRKKHVFMKWRHCLPVTHARAHTQQCVSVTQHWLEQTGVEVLWSGEACLRKCVCVCVCVCVCTAGKLLLSYMTMDGRTLQGSCSGIGFASYIITHGNFDICKSIWFKSKITLRNLLINKVVSCLLKYLYKVTVCLF